MASDIIQTPVLIVGGGIVGLSASLFLSHHGIPCVLVERHSGTSIHPRARSVNARSMEIFRSIGISDAVREAGAVMASSVGIFSGQSVKSIIEPKPRTEKRRNFPLVNLFSDLGPEPGTFGTQDLTEPVLLRYAKERGVDARFYTECLGVQQDKDRVTAKLKNRETGSTYTVVADYLIAADGANSPIRTQLGIERTGQGTLGNLLNILFTTSPSLEGFVKGREFSICQIDSPEVCGLFTSINNADRWVFHLLYSPTKGEKPEDFPPEVCVKLLHKALGMDDIDIEIKSILPWQASVRVAKRIQADRIFLAGDAAHQMPPWAGQGANSGISDVHNLAWKLASVLRSQASPSLLSTYEIERLPVGKAAAEISGSAGDDRGLISTRKDLKTAISLIRRLYIIAGFGYTYSSTSIVQESTWPLGGATWQSWTMPSVFLSLDGRPGTRAPHVWVEKEGERISTLDLFGKTFVLFTGSDGESWKKAADAVSKSLNGVEVEALSAGTNGDIVDKDGKWEAAAGISHTGALLVRPDGFVAWRMRRVPAECEKALKEVLKRVMSI